MQPAITDLSFTIPAAGGASADPRSYIDTAKELSKINRRLYSQGRMYAFQGLTFIWRASAVPAPNDLASVELSVRTAGNSWVVQNAHVKGEALWHQMQELVLEDNPSIRGKWHDFKVLLSNDHVQTRVLNVKDGAGTDVKGGEWAIATYVMPQHAVDGAGVPLPAEEFQPVMIGVEAGNKKSLVLAYEQSRATVSANQPNVPAGMSDSFFNLLTDSGSQEPELADVIEEENDNPPYDLDEYPGGSTNAPDPITVGFGAISAAEVDGRVGGFVAPCGLLEIEITGFNSVGVPLAVAHMPSIDLILHVAPGMYKGVASVTMGQ